MKTCNQKEGKSQKRKHHYQKSMNIKTMFTKILSPQETTDEIGIGSDWPKLI